MKDNLEWVAEGICSKNEFKYITRMPNQVLYNGMKSRLLTHHS